MGCCQTAVPSLYEAEIFDQLKNHADKTYIAVSDQAHKAKEISHNLELENLKNQVERTYSLVNDQAKYMKDLSPSLELDTLKTQAEKAINDQAKYVKELSNNVEGQMLLMNEQAGDFVRENIKDPALAMGSNLGTFIRENIQETLDAIKDLKLKQRVSDIIYPIFRRIFVHSVHGSVENTYQIQEILGQGGFSIVRRAVHLEQGQERAIKMISKTSINDSQLLEIQEETEILKGLDHPNIIRVIEIIEDTTKINIVTELCKGGELFERIVASRTFSENIAANYMYQILSGLIHIHMSGFIHKDLKPENIMFVEENESYLKIIDFGISQKQGSSRSQKRVQGSVRDI